MADRPILFSAPMVRALLAGTKTQTRRTLNPQPPRGDHYGKDIMDWGLSGIYQDDDNEGTNRWWLDVQTDVDDNSHREFKVSAAVGERLYVREHWRTDLLLDALPPRSISAGGTNIQYIADASLHGSEKTWVGPGKHRQAMHMPRWASRLTLLVTDVRIERLQDITRADALAEGISQYGRFYGLPDTDWDDADLTAEGAYFRLWDRINGAGAADLNPFVVAYTFDVLKQNIDQIGRAVA
ncbi:hypothetical protein EQW76_00540 [Rhizobium sp. rho-13.1]|uniref:hypothetical protein n=1 Tax=Rhizobium sp. rho-13.1 TaxID=2506431 RepID=UPI00115F19DF|nr:hypothetical protein [Rhizobium sp. rho-13.1]TQX91263.1 hypothetical protein EQW76_00540 [Rhizobium sp. rho-13.1]